jgi:hypothetical protein
MVETHHHCEVAKVRKPAPQFEAMSYYNGFKKVKLSDYAGKCQPDLINLCLKYFDYMINSPMFN